MDDDDFIDSMDEFNDNETLFTIYYNLLPDFETWYAFICTVPEYSQKTFKKYFRDFVCNVIRLKRTWKYSQSSCGMHDHPCYQTN